MECEKIYGRLSFSNTFLWTLTAFSIHLENESFLQENVREVFPTDKKISLQLVIPSSSDLLNIDFFLLKHVRFRPLPLTFSCPRPILLQIQYFSKWQQQCAFHVCEQPKNKTRIWVNTSNQQNSFPFPYGSEKRLITLWGEPRSSVAKKVTNWCSLTVEFWYTFIHLITSPQFHSK